MASTSSRMAASVLVFLLLLAASEMMGTTRVAEARHCASQSHSFVGACLSRSNCAHVCRTEGFPWGECRWHGIVSKCHCKRIC